MLNDRILKNAKPKEKAYKLTDRDGMYAYIATSGSISFRFDYHFNGRRETLTIGRYGIITLSEARERLLAAKKKLEQGISPAKEKKDRKEATRTGETFGAWFIKYIDNAHFADSTRQLREETYERNIKRGFDNKKMTEITSQDVRALCDKIKERGAPSTAIPTRFNLKKDGVHKMYTTDTMGREKEITYINEPNLYRVIFRSNKPEAVM